MQNKHKSQIVVSLSKEHADQAKNVRKVFSDLPVEVSADHIRLSAEELAMQITIEIGKWIVAGVSWDLLKVAIKKLRAKYPKSSIAIRDKESILFAIRSDETVNVVVVPDRVEEFGHIKMLDDLIEYLSIESGWRQSILGDIGSFSKGSGITKKELSKAGYGAIRYGELYTVHDVKIKKIYSFINSNIAQNATRVKKDDILFTGSGETIDEIGKSAVYLGEKEVCAGGDIIIFSPEKDDGLFLALLLNSILLRKQLRRFGQGQSVVHIYKKDLSKLEINLPPLSEQKRIVSVIETWDKVIDLIEKKIELKEQLKKGLMQQLLSGQKRLPGFEGRWNTIELGHLFEFQNGYAFKSAHFSDNEGIRIIRNRDLKLKSSSKLYLEGNGFDEDYKVHDNDLLVGMDGDFIAHYWAQGEALLNQRVGRIRNFKNSNKEFIYYFIQVPLKRIENETSSTTVKHLSAKQLIKRIVKVPGSDEQLAIADVLITAERELRLLGIKIKSLQSQKNYLLNNLVTGKIRTPKDMKITENA